MLQISLVLQVAPIVTGQTHQPQLSIILRFFFVPFMSDSCHNKAIWSTTTEGVVKVTKSSVLLSRCLRAYLSISCTQNSAEVIYQALWPKFGTFSGSLGIVGVGNKDREVFESQAARSAVVHALLIRYNVPVESSSLVSQFSSSQWRTVN